jgi:hypothetical protein
MSVACSIISGKGRPINIAHMIIYYIYNAVLICACKPNLMLCPNS